MPDALAIQYKQEDYAVLEEAAVFLLFTFFLSYLQRVYSWGPRLTTPCGAPNRARPKLGLVIALFIILGITLGDGSPSLGARGH
jgi:hypothetical protein